MTPRSSFCSSPALGLRLRSHEPVKEARHSVMEGRREHQRRVVRQISPLLCPLDQNAKPVLVQTSRALSPWCHALRPQAAKAAPLG